MIQREDVVTEIKKFQSSAHSLLTAWLQYEGEFQVTDFTKDYFAEHSFEGVVADIDLWVDSCEETELSIKGFTKENTGGNCTALMFATGKNEYCITEVDDPSIPKKYPVRIGLYIDSDLKCNVICENEAEVLNFVKETL